MKRFCRIFVPLILVCAVVFLMGWSGNEALEKSSGATWNAASAEPVRVTEWPENEYTAQIIRPEGDELHYICDFSDAGRYAVFMKNMPWEKAFHYIEELKKQGYTEIASEEGKVSIGTILQREHVALSIAHSGTTLTILITMAEHANQ